MVRFIMTQSRRGASVCVCMCEKTKQAKEPVRVAPVRQQLRSNNGGEGARQGEKNAKNGIFSEITLPPRIFSG